MMERLKKLPVPVLPTFVGTLTLSNVYGGMGYTWLRYLVMAIATVVIIAYTVKIIKYPKVCAGEYANTVPASLYAGFTMCLMILGSFFYELGLGFGKAIWFVAVIIHAVHIVVFTYNNVIKKRDINTTVPSWFVTYNGIMVSCVTGGAMNAKGMLGVITVYGIIIYLILIPVMIVINASSMKLAPRTCRLGAALAALSFWVKNSMVRAGLARMIRPIAHGNAMIVDIRSPSDIVP